MNLSEFSVKNWQFMLVMFVGVVALGLNSLFTMPRSEDPTFEAPTFIISVIYPGTDPKDMEELVVDPVEKRLNELKDVRNIRTTIDDGLAVFLLEYDYSIDNDEKKQEIAREVNSMRGILPNDIFDIRYFQFDPGLVNIVHSAKFHQGMITVQIMRCHTFLKRVIVLITATFRPRFNPFSVLLSHNLHF